MPGSLLIVSGIWAAVCSGPFLSLSAKDSACTAHASRRDAWLGSCLTCGSNARAMTLQMAVLVPAAPLRLPYCRVRGGSLMFHSSATAKQLAVPVKHSRRWVRRPGRRRSKSGSTRRASLLSCSAAMALHRCAAQHCLPVSLAHDTPFYVGGSEGDEVCCAVLYEYTRSVMWDAMGYGRFQRVHGKLDSDDASWIKYRKVSDDLSRVQNAWALRHVALGSQTPVIKWR